MREPTLKHVLLQPLKWFTKIKKAMESHVVEHYQRFEEDPDSVLSESGEDTEEEEQEEEPDEPKERKVSAAPACTSNNHDSFLMWFF